MPPLGTSECRSENDESDKYGDVFSGQAGRAPKGGGSLAGGERSEPPEYCNKRMRPGSGRGAGSSCNPCRGAYRRSSSTGGLASLTPG